MLKSYIGGRWVAGTTGELYPDINPATGELLGQMSVAGPAEVDLAVRTAYEAFESWRAVPAPRRGEILYPHRAAHRASARKSLARLMSAGDGQSAARSPGRRAGGHRR